MDVAAAVSITRLELDAGGLRRAASRAKDADASRRMLALALVLEGRRRDEAARLCGMDRQTLRDWVHRYNAEGLEGLVDRRSAGPACRLDLAQQQQVAEWVRLGPDVAVDGVVRWRRIDLKRRIEKAFGVELAERSVGTLLKRLGFRRLSVRPQHPAGDPEAQSTHKKTSPIWSQPPSPRGGAASRSSSGGRTRPGSASKPR